MLRRRLLRMTLNTSGSSCRDVPPGRCSNLQVETNQGPPDYLLLIGHCIYPRESPKTSSPLFRASYQVDKTSSATVRSILQYTLADLPRFSSGSDLRIVFACARSSRTTHPPQIISHFLMNNYPEAVVEGLIVPCDNVSDRVAVIACATSGRNSLWKRVLCEDVGSIVSSERDGENVSGECQYSISIHPPDWRVVMFD